MKQDTTYKKALLSVTYPEPSPNIGHLVMEKIYRKILIRDRIRAGLHLIVVVAAVLSFVPALNYLASAAAQSGFIEYVSLSMSDGLTVLGSWQSFVLLIAETAPIVATSIVLALILAIAYSLRRSVWYIAHAHEYKDAVAPLATA